jgi:hypothetical protein
MRDRSTTSARVLRLTPSPRHAAARPAARRHGALSARGLATSPSDQARPRGVALIASPELRGGRAYLCEPDGHRIDVLDQDYRPLFSFGGRGSALGLLESPSDLAIVWLDGAPPADRTAETAVLVVADRGNHRIQLFELNGAPICAIGGRAGTPSPNRWPMRSGWPFFRLVDPPALACPSRLEWHAPYLDVECAGGAMVRLDLAAALLPDFRTWIREAPARVLRQAFRRFAANPPRAEVPAGCLMQIMERLQSPPPRGVVLPWRGRA